MGIRAMGVVAGIVAVGFVSSPASAKTVTCKSVIPKDGATDAAVNIKGKNVTCTVARRIARKVMVDGTDKPEGYKCPAANKYAATSIRCTKGKHVVSWNVKFQ
jgi:hypothetical protein